MTTVYISPKAKKFLKRTLSGKVVEQLVRNGEALRQHGSVTMKIDGKEFTMAVAQPSSPKGK